MKKFSAEKKQYPITDFDVIDHVDFSIRIKNRNFKEVMSEFEKTMILEVLANFAGNQKEAAKFLKLKYTTLNEKIKKYNIRQLEKP